MTSIRRNEVYSINIASGVRGRNHILAYLIYFLLFYTPLFSFRSVKPFSSYKKTILQTGQILKMEELKSVIKLIFIRHTLQNLVYI